MAHPHTGALGMLPLKPHLFEILMALDRGPAHGYAIIKEIEAQSGGAVRLGTSSLYAAIRQMQSKGLVENAGTQAGRESGGPPRQYFRITQLGVRVGRLEAQRLREVAVRARGRFSAKPPDGEASS